MKRRTGKVGGRKAEKSMRGKERERLRKNGNRRNELSAYEDKTYERRNIEQEEDELGKEPGIRTGGKGV